MSASAAGSSSTGAGSSCAGAGGGSSTMPQKANPVAAETITALARLTACLTAPVHLAALHAEERDGAAWGLEWLVLPQIVVATAAALRHAQGLADTLAPDAERMREVLEAGGVRLDLRTRRATTDGRDVDLSAREFTLAETFMLNAGNVLSREQLLDHVWGLDFDPGSNVVDVYVGYLRRKFGPQTITTVRGMGYRFNA